MADAALAPGLTVVPANEASWDDLQAVFGTQAEALKNQINDAL